jgi:hypothetical protein
LLRSYSLGFAWSEVQEQLLKMHLPNRPLPMALRTRLQARLRQRYVPIFRKVLPGKKAATFFRLDRRISTMIATSSSPEPGLNFLVATGYVRGREINRADRFCVDDHE